MPPTDPTAIDEMIESARPGDRLRTVYGKDHPSNKLEHVRGIVDGYFVLRTWRPGRGWRYSIEPPEYLFVGLRAGTMTIEKGPGHAAK